MPSTKIDLSRPEKPRIRDRFRHFGLAVAKSCYDMEFYRKVRSEKWTVSLAYYLRLMTVVTLVLTVISGPAIHQGMEAAKGFIDEKVPEGSSLTVAGGQLSAVLPMPMEFGDKDGRFILDTSVSGLDFPRERIGDSGVLIGQDAIFFRQNSIEERTYALKEMPNFSVNKRGLLDWFDRYLLTVSIGLSLLLALFFFMAEVVGYFIFVASGAWLSLLLARLWKVHLDYAQWLAVGLHAVTLPLIVSAIFDAMGWHEVPVFSIVFFMIMASVVADERAAGAAAAQAYADLPTLPDKGPLVPPSDESKNKAEKPGKRTKKNKKDSGKK